MPFKPWLDDTQDVGMPADSDADTIDNVQSYLDAPKPDSPSAPKAMDPKVRQYMMDKYFQASDRSGVTDAQDKAKTLGAIGVGAQALSLATQGNTQPQVFKKGWNETGRPQMTEAYESHIDTSPLTKAGDEGVKSAEAARAAKIQDFEMGNKLENQARNDSIQDEKLGMEREDQRMKGESHGMQMRKGEADLAQDAAMNDPNSDQSRGLRDFIKQVSPNLASGPSFDRASYGDLSKVYGPLINAYESRKSSEAGQDKRLAMQEAGADRRAQMATDSLASRERMAAAKAETKDASPDQYKAAGFAKRMDQAESVFDSLSKSGYHRENNKEGLSSFLPDAMKGESLKSQEQAERNFVNSVLRRESGAAISPSEFKSAELQYFPRAGDTAQVLTQKAANRQQAVETMKAEGGPAYAKIPTVQVPGLKAMPPEDQAAVEWAKANPNDPRSAQILKLHE